MSRTAAIVRDRDSRDSIATLPVFPDERNVEFYSLTSYSSDMHVNPVVCIPNNGDCSTYPFATPAPLMHGKLDISASQNAWKTQSLPVRTSDIGISRFCHSQNSGIFQEKIPEVLENVNAINSMMSINGVFQLP